MSPRNQRSAEAEQYRKWYHTEAWQRIREQAFVRDRGICHICHTIIIGRYDGDHVVPHKGERSLFFDAGNVKPAHPRCHASTKQSEELTGRAKPVIGLDGWPA